MNKKQLKFCEEKLKDGWYHTEISLKMIKSPITVLLGPNGTGKSTSLALMKDELKRKKIKRIMYTTRQNDMTKQSYFHPEYLIGNFESEGEKMDDSFYLWTNGELLKSVLEDNKELYILIDEIDSGLSIDKLYQELKDILFIMHEELKKGRKIKLILTANSYEVIDLLQDEEFDIIWVPTKQYIKINSYKSFKKKYIDYYNEMHK